MSDVESMLLPICVPANASEIRAIFKRLQGRIAELEAKLNAADERIAGLEGAINRHNEEIQQMRSLEDSYDTQDEVMATIFLKLNDLCDEIEARPLLTATRDTE